MRFAPVAAPRPHEKVVSSVLDGQLALFHLATRRLHLLNGSAAAIWEALGSADTIGDVTVLLGDAFEVDPLTIRLDVEKTIDQLRADGLLCMNDRFVPLSPAPRRAKLSGAVDVPATGAYSALDADVGIICNDEEICRAIDDVLRPLHTLRPPNQAIEISAEGESAWTVTVPGSDPVRVGSRLSAVLRSIAEVNNLAVASVPGDLVFHAGAVGFDGQAVVMPAASNQGKSTLTTALVTAGFTYLTDEAAVITGDLEVRPFAKSIALDPGSFPLFASLAPSESETGLVRALASREWHIDPARIGLTGAPTPLTAVVCPHWRAGSTTRVTELSKSEALHLLLGESFDFAAGGQPVFERLVQVVSEVPVYRLGYSDLDEAVEMVGEILAGNESVTSSARGGRDDVR